MNPLYSTSITYSYEEYKRFNLTLFLKPKRFILYVVTALFILITGLILDDLFLIVFGIAYPTLMFTVMPIVQIIHAKKVWKSNKSAQNLHIQFEFYDTYYTAKDEYGEGKVEYSKLHKIIETKTNFYLMSAKNQGMILSKSNFPEGLTEFLRTIEIK